MDKALANSLDRYIFKLQEVAHQLKGSRTGGFRKANRNNAAIALKSAADFLAYCALVALFRRNIGRLSEQSCVAVISVPSHWRLADVDEAAKIILKAEKGVKVCLHPTSKNRRGWEIDAAELLESGEKLIIFAREGSPIHEDFELAATLRDRLNLPDARHIHALSKLRGCGTLSNDQVAVIAQQPSERMEAIFRRGQPAARAAARLMDARRQAATAPVKHFDLSRGFGEAGVWAQELKKDIQEWRDGRLPWSEVDKGCLLYGPPGTGKTRFAAALAAECGLNLEVASISKWQSYKDGDLGDMLKAMHQSFAGAKENAPSLLFIDEFDSIGDRSKFPARHATYSTTVVNALLEALDGIEGREGVVVLGACNYPEKIDAALLRSGRLEKHVHFRLPDAAARAEILAFHLPSLADEPALKQIAARLPEKSGADLERLSREARRTARRERRPVTIDDLRSKIEPLPLLNDGQLLNIAIHEAGHALVGHALQVGRIERVEIFDNVENFAIDLDSHGITVIELPKRPFTTKWEMVKLIAFHLAGAAAEEVVYKSPSNLAAGRKESDFAKATSLAVEMVTQHGFGSSPYFLPGSVDTNSPSDLWQDRRLAAEVNKILQSEYDRARDMLSGLELCLIAFAAKLGKQKRLQGEELEKLWPGAETSDETLARK